ncbi:MAG TPA: lycopene cyclase domain-containing protein [Mycobacteriales bacterium]|nr:lycopene cyclase domain-containing protein [Mycobacteriales bacterium]
MTYTGSVVVGVAFAVLLDLGLLRTNLLRRKAFWASYAIIFCFQLLVNGILTGKRLVIYSPGNVLGNATPHLFGGWRIADAPVEDLLFGFSLVLQTLAWWTWWGRGSSRGQPISPRSRNVS